MADFVQTMKDMRRMCNVYASNCDKCPLASYECACTPKHRLYFTDKQVEEIVAAWAAEHPEPVYPSWYRWLIIMGAIGSVEDLFSDLQREIPADIAEKLGIEPKEGTRGT